MTTVTANQDGVLNLDVAKPPRRFRLSPRIVGSYAVLLFLTVLYLGPLLMLVNTSFMTTREFNRNATALPSSLNFSNFEEAWEEANFAQYIANSIFYAATATIVYVLTAVFLAFPVARGYIRGGNLVLTLFVIALFLPPALIPQFQLVLNLGLYNTRTGYIMLLVTNPVGIIIL
ncbi:MAG: carbohydrate ABC transporter permease, partial [Chloroflexi bacterium]|nr:carbohydrate ABC transporter permease [Chloroflexota bacterium]